MATLSGVQSEVRTISPDDPAMRAEILLLSSSDRAPRLEHDGADVWDVLAIGEYLAEIRPKAGLLPADRAARAHCRAIRGEMRSGFVSMRTALPMNLEARFPGFRVWTRAQTGVDRVVEIRTDCLER